MSDWARAEPFDVVVLVCALSLLVGLPLVHWSWTALRRLYRRYSVRRGMRVGRW